MALTNYLDRNEPISHEAPTYLGCDVPVANEREPQDSRADRRVSVRVQRIPKALRLHQGIGIAVFGVGMFLALANMGILSERMGVSIMIVGLTWYVVSTAKVWRHHG